jgi:predicted Zn-dependent peptidase
VTFKKTTLDNGLRIITASLKESQSVAVSIMAGVGSRYETDKNAGVSHFLEHLLFKGTKKRPTTQIIAELVDGVGGMHNAYTSNDMTCYYIKLPRQHAKLAIDILADMIRHPLLDPVEVDRERGVVIEEMHVYRDDPARYINDLLPQLIWPKDPLGREIIGTEDVINAIPRDDIADFQARYYSPSNLVVAVSGDIDHDTVVKQITELMGDMKRFEVPAITKLKTELAPELTYELEQETNQAHLLIGCQAYPYDHLNDAAARVLTTILGGGMSSRLFINVRERQGLAYHVYADYNNYVDTGLFSIYGGINLDKTEQAIESILAELERLRIEPVSEAELTKVKNKMSGSLQMALENTFAIADRMGTRLLLLDQIKTPEETIAEIDAITAEDVMRVAKDLLVPERLRMAVIAPDTKAITKRFTELIRSNNGRK